MTDVKHSERDCICDKCINDYMVMYDKLSVMMLSLHRLSRIMTRKKRTKINDIIHKRISAKKKKRTLIRR